jgi:hypothetical protein
MCTLMNLQTTLLTEWFITHITEILTVLTMYVLMLLQMAPLPE